jgi:DNA-binding XRE family transcriptional regulator
MSASTISFETVLAREQLRDPTFGAEWQRLAPAREFSEALIQYRVDHDLGQRALAARLGVSQPRVARLESGEHNPSIDTIINVVRQLGIEFCLDVSPADRAPKLVTARVRNSRAIDHDDVTVVAASAA